MQIFFWIMSISQWFLSQCNVLMTVFRDVTHYECALWWDNQLLFLVDALKLVISEVTAVGSRAREFSHSLHTYFVPVAVKILDNRRKCQHEVIVHRLVLLSRPWVCETLAANAMLCRSLSSTLLPVASSVCACTNFLLPPTDNSCATFSLSAPSSLLCSVKCCLGDSMVVTAVDFFND